MFDNEISSLHNVLQAFFISLRLSHKPSPYHGLHYRVHNHPIRSQSQGQHFSLTDAQAHSTCRRNASRQAVYGPSLPANQHRCPPSLRLWQTNRKATHAPPADLQRKRPKKLVCPNCQGLYVSSASPCYLSLFFTLSLFRSANLNNSRYILFFLFLTFHRAYILLIMQPKAAEYTPPNR